MCCMNVCTYVQTDSYPPPHSPIPHCQVRICVCVHTPPLPLTPHTPRSPLTPHTPPSFPSSLPTYHPHFSHHPHLPHTSPLTHHPHSTSHTPLTPDTLFPIAHHTHANHHPLTSSSSFNSTSRFSCSMKLTKSCGRLRAYWEGSCRGRGY